MSFKFLKDRKIPPIVLSILLYLTFCASNWYEMRNALAFMAITNRVSFLANDVVGFIAAGIVPILIFSLFVNLVIQPRTAGRAFGGSNLSYSLQFFVILANITCFLIKLAGIWYPFANIFFGVFVDFIVIAGFGVWYLFFLKKYYIPKDRIGKFTARLAGFYLGVYSALTAFNIIAEVLL